MRVPSPISTDNCAQITAPLRPEFRARTSRAPGANVRRTDGWKHPSGLERVELVTFTLSPKSKVEFAATLRMGRPTNRTLPSN